ncbi:hypothetical protein CRENBAI_003994 [Crenichthys baileyi]|uniref:Uncharacterized protein n=1 Tax=Crenichthys baileyi TaxID=28760 RepID=A0AAV9SJN6_9TELE
MQPVACRVQHAAGPQHHNMSPLDPRRQTQTLHVSCASGASEITGEAPRNSLKADRFQQETGVEIPLLFTHTIRKKTTVALLFLMKIRFPSALPVPPPLSSLSSAHLCRHDNSRVHVVRQLFPR